MHTFRCSNSGTVVVTIAIPFKEFYFSHMAYSSGYTYSMKNCLYESVLDKIIGICKCKPTFVNFKLWVFKCQL